jgi:hypothetical protein
MHTALQRLEVQRTFTGIVSGLLIAVYLSSAGFTSVFETELSNEVPVIKASLAGTRLVGRLSVGKKFFTEKFVHFYFNSY